MTTVQWLTPPPLWDEPAIRSDRARLRRPALLRFATDDFIESLQATLAQTPTRLKEFIARYETWRAPAAGLTAEQSGGPLTLYQPLHGRFYLLGAALTCRVPGFPDHGVKPDQDERVGFVLRRLPAAGDTAATEYAWIDDPQGWIPAASDRLIEGEQVLPLFPLAFGTNGGRRRLFAGVIPTGHRETYTAGRSRAAPALAGVAAPTTDPDPRRVEFQRAVVDPWAAMLDWYDRTLAGAPKAADLSSIEQSDALLLLDFASFLEQQIPPAWSAITASVRPAPGPLRDLYDALGVALTNAHTGTLMTLRAALIACHVKQQELEDASFAGAQPPTLPAGVPWVHLYEPGVRVLMEPKTARPIVGLIAAALPSQPATPLAARAPAMAPSAPGTAAQFIARCVYERPRCPPPSALLSEASEPFRLASVFDPNAPARPVQVALPLDTTPAALRKYDKNVAFLISDELAKQLNRVKGIKQLMDGDVDDAGIGLGMICSLSIPIITLCAFFVLMIFIMLLNIVFWWMPFFKICFPVPVLKGKD
jgi:hypothetical protein